MTTDLFIAPAVLSVFFRIICSNNIEQTSFDSECFLLLVISDYLQQQYLVEIIGDHVTASHPNILSRYLLMFYLALWSLPRIRM